MMKKFLFVAALFTMALPCFSQSFEGKITYQNTFKSKIPNVTDEQFSAMMGEKQEYILKGGNYKSIMNGTMMQWQLYLQKDNKLYSKMAGSDIIFYNDGAVNKDEVIKAEINKGVADILGYKCDELVLTCKSGIQKFYYNSAIKVDGALFKDHKFGNWSEVLSRINAMPLKISMDSPQFSLESVALDVKKEKVDDAIFALPAGAIVQKSPY
jgi:hypothetical protein